MRVLVEVDLEGILLLLKKKERLIEGEGKREEKKEKTYKEEEERRKRRKTPCATNTHKNMSNKINRPSGGSKESSFRGRCGE